MLTVFCWVLKQQFEFVTNNSELYQTFYNWLRTILSCSVYASSNESKIVWIEMVGTFSLPGRGGGVSSVLRACLGTRLFPVLSVPKLQALVYDMVPESDARSVSWPLTPHSAHRFLAPSSKLCQNWLRHLLQFCFMSTEASTWRGTLYLRATVYRRASAPSKRFGY